MKAAAKVNKAFKSNKQGFFMNTPQGHYCGGDAVNNALQYPLITYERMRASIAHLAENHEHNHVQNACVPGNDNGDLSTECLSYLVKKYSKLDLGHELVFTKVKKQNLRHRQSVANFFRSEDVAKNDRRFILFGWQAYPKSQQEPKNPMPPHWTAVKKINDKMMIIDDRYLSSGVIKPLEADEMGLQKVFCKNSSILVFEIRKKFE